MTQQAGRTGMLSDASPSENERRWPVQGQPINAFIDRHGLLSSRLRYRPDRDHLRPPSGE
jgi:hypothetical protein